MWAGCTRARTSTSACGDNAWSTDSQVRSLWRAWRRAAPISHSFGCDFTLGRKNASVLSTHQGHERRSRALAGSLGGRAPTAGRGTPTLAPIAPVEPDQPAFAGDQPPAARAWPGDPASRVTRCARARKTAAIGGRAFARRSLSFRGRVSPLGSELRKSHLNRLFPEVIELTPRTGVVHGHLLRNEGERCARDGRVR
jgi:hypothetical protein